ncbi:hypothetical protein J5D20_05340 [Helicobacter pylori]|nr:hypothetical protein J5D20_05340 [Helicobacter pylori]
MFYHLIAPLKNKTPPLTYFSKERHLKGALVNIPLRNRTLLGVVLEEVSKPSFECLELEKTPYFLLPFQMERFHNQELNALELLKDYLHESCQNEYLHNELQKLLEKISSCSIT